MSYYVDGGFKNDVILLHLSGGTVPMKIALFSAKAYDRDYFEQANQQFDYSIDYFDVRLDAKTRKLMVIPLFVHSLMMMIFLAQY